MSILKSTLKKTLFRASANPLIQGILEYNVHVSHLLMGVGSGAEVLSSGEQTIFHDLRQRSTPPYCIFDVGSNQGQYLSLILDNIAVDDFSIHCFEPGRQSYSILAESFRDDKRIKLNNIGIGKEKGEAVLYFDRAGSGIASLTKRRLGHFGIDFNQSERVAVNTLDSYCEENAITHIHLLKLDIEGHEIDALAGARRMFDERAIDLVTFEFGGCNIDTRTFFQDFWYFFREINMRILRITPTGYWHPLMSYKEIHEQFRTTNFVALLNNTAGSHLPWNRRPARVPPCIMT